MTISVHNAMKRPTLLALLVSGACAAAAWGQTLDVLISEGLSEPFGLEVDEDNAYYIADSANHRIAKYQPESGTLTNYSGALGQSGYVDGSALAARFYTPQGLSYIPGTGLAVADSGNHAIRIITSSGEVRTLAGGKSGFQDGTGGQASFRSPCGLATDYLGNLYVADLQNNAVRKVTIADGVVTTYAKGFFRPSAVAVGDGGILYVADSGNNAIRTVDTNGVVKLIAGSGRSSIFGFLDSVTGTDALLNNPESLLWMGAANGLLVGESRNQSLRKVTYNEDQGTHSVSTFLAPTPSILESPMGIARDLNGSLLISDLSQDRIVHIPNTGVVLPPLPEPSIGLIVLTNMEGQLTTILYPSKEATLLDDSQVVFGILSQPGITTYYVVGTNQFGSDLPDPTRTNAIAPVFMDGMPQIPPSIVPVISPDIYIKAISSQPGRRSSPVGFAHYRFKVATPQLVSDTTSPSNYRLECLTSGAQLWYTTDGSDPSEANPAALLYTGKTFQFSGMETDVVFKARGFKAGFYNSDLFTRVFSASQVEVSPMGFTRDFQGNPGAVVVLPVEFRLLSSQGAEFFTKLQSIQFRIEVQAKGGAPTVEEYLRVLPPGSDGGFIPLSPLGYPTYTASYMESNRVGVALAYLGTNSLRDLNQTGPFTLVALKVPGSARAGQSYELSVLEASATFDGWQSPVPLSVRSNRVLNVTNTSYLVGDSSLADWYNVGDFGDGKLDNSDANTAFYASLGVRQPFPFTDVFDSMDAFPLDTEETVGGDGQLRFLDWQIILERSLSLRQDNWRRERDSSGARRAVSTSSTKGAALYAAAEQPAPSSTWSRPVTLWVGSAERVAPGAEVALPVYLAVKPGYNWAGGQIWFAVTSKGDGVDSEASYTFVPNGDSGVPMPSASPVLGYSGKNLVYVWYRNQISPPLSGSNRIGNLLVTMPPGGVAEDHYYVRFAVADGASSEDTQLDCATIPGTIWMGGPAASPPETLPDQWKTNFFGSLTNAVSSFLADPDADGISNQAEYFLGTNPTVPDWKVSVSVQAGQVRVAWFGETGKQYQVYSSSDLKTWEPVTEPVSGDNQNQEYRGPLGLSEAKYFRVKTLSF